MSTEAPKLPDSALPPDKGREYAEQMIKKAEGEQPKPEEKKSEEQPQLIAGKFKTQDDLVKAYEELQKKLGATPPNKEEQPAKKVSTDPNLAVDKKDETAETDADKAQKAVAEAGLDWNALNGEWAEKGELSPESYAKLEKGGIPKSMVDQFINGQVAVARLTRAEVTGSVGGEEKYAELMEFAKVNLSAEEQEAYNKIANSGDIAAIKIAAKGLLSRFEQENGREPNLINGGKGEPAGYRSLDELKKDMADPKYANDPTFRAEVERKLRASPNI
jgi:hypothetical protein